MTYKIFLTIIATALFLSGVATAQARMSYGGGEYTNLCGGGTNAEVYSCNNGCNPTTGRCESISQSVVKWTCNGRLNQCGQNESGWSNIQEIGQPGCDKTIQISLFDKNCRKADGSWDSTCILQGYMVWYSGSCNGLSPTAGYSATPSAGMTGTLKPTVKVTVKPTVRPSGTIYPTDAAGSTLSGGTKGGVTTTPETGPETVWTLLLIGGAASLGFWMKKTARKIL